MQGTLPELTVLSCGMEDFMKKNRRYIRKANRKKISGASVIALLTFIIGAAFFAMGMYLTISSASDASVIAVLGWLAFLICILGIVVEILNFKVMERFLLFDKWGVALNSILAAGIAAIYIWGLIV